MSTPEAVLIYDGKCPFCSRYAELLRLRESLGTLRLINARDGGVDVDRIVAQGYDLDEGMVLVLGGQVHHGADCIHRLALMTTKSSRFNRLNGALFRSRTASRALYPILKFGRNVTLRILGRPKLDLAPAPDHRSIET